jgi:hypothetical protein
MDAPDRRSGNNLRSRQQLRGLLGRPIEDFDISVRALRVLNRLDIRRVGDLAKLTPKAISSQRNCGRKTIAEISEFVQRLGVLLKELSVAKGHVESSGSETAPEATEPCRAEEFGRLARAQQIALLRRVSELRLSTRAHNTLANLGIVYIGDLIQLTPSYLLRNRNFGRNSLKEIENVLEGLGFSLGRTLLGWDRDSAAALETTFEEELNAVRHEEINHRLQTGLDDRQTQTQVPGATDPIEDSLRTALNATPGWRIRPKAGKALLLETTLHEFLRSQTGSRDAEILHRLYGWDGLGPRTLESIGQEYGITRERVRQISARLKKHLGGTKISDLEIVTRAISHAASRCPCPADLIEQELCDLWISEKPFRLEGLLSACALSGGNPPFEITLIEGVRFVGPSSTTGLGRSILHLARRLVEHWGCTTVVELCEQSCATEDFVRQVLQVSSRFDWLYQDKRWFRFMAQRRNRLVNQIRKILSVTNPIDIGELRSAVGRHHRMAGFAPPREVLLELCNRLPDCVVVGRKVSAWPPIETTAVLSENELILLGALKRLGTITSREELEEYCMEAGMNRNSFDIYLTYSPIIARYGKGVYGLVGSEEVSASGVEALRAPIRPKRALLDHGWTPDGRVWVAYRLSRSNIGSALFHIPSAIKDFVEGDFRLKSKDASALGNLQIRNGMLWGLGKVFQRRGGEVGDTFVVCLNARTREASIEIDGFELLDRYASGSDDLIQSTSSSPSAACIVQ